MPALLAQLLSLHQQSLPSLLPFFQTSRQRDALGSQLKHLSATLQQTSCRTGLSTGDHPGGVQDLSGTRHEDGPIGSRIGLLFPQSRGILKGIDEYHSIEEIVTGRFAPPLHLDQIDRTSDHTGPALHREPPGARCRIPRRPARLLRDERAPPEIFPFEKLNRLASGCRIIDKPSSDPFAQYRFHRTVPSGRHNQPLGNGVANPGTGFECRSPFVAAPPITHIFLQHALQRSEMRVHCGQLFRLTKYQLLDFG